MTSRSPREHTLERLRAAIEWLRRLLEAVATDLDRQGREHAFVEPDALTKRAARIRERLSQRGRDPDTVP